MTTLYVDGRPVDVELWVEDGWIWLRSPYDPALVTEVRALARRRWVPEQKLWRCQDNGRNRFALRLLARDPVLAERYDAPLEPVQSARPLFAAQANLMVPHLVQRRQCLLAAQMRTGKTLAVIEAMERVDVGDWLWVGPPKTLPAIRREFARWDAQTVPKRFVSPNELRLQRVGVDDPPQGVVFDESVAYKNPTASRTVIASELRRAMDEEHGDDACVWLLSGYPAPQDPVDWWAQAELARPGFLRESTAWQLRERLAELEDSDVGGTKHKVVKAWRPDEVKLLGRRLEGLVLRVERKDCYDIPVKAYEEAVAAPPEDMLQVARALVDVAGSAGKALTLLRELSDGFQYRTRPDGTRETLEGGTPKDAVVREQLGRFERYARLLFFAGFQGSIDRIGQLCLEEGWSVLQLDGRGWRYRPADGQPAHPPSDATFQDLEKVPEKLALVAHPGSGGKGLDFSAAPAAVFFSNDFNGDSRTQAEERILGPNPTGTLIVDVYCLPSDRYVRDRLREKGTLAGTTLKELRRLLA